AQHVVEPRRLEVFDAHVAYHEELAASLGELGVRRTAERAQPLGAGPLEEAQVVSVVDDAARIGVLIVDTDRPAEDRSGGGLRGFWWHAVGGTNSSIGDSINRGDRVTSAQHSGRLRNQLPGQAGEQERAAGREDGPPCA